MKRTSGSIPIFILSVFVLSGCNLPSSPSQVPSATGTTEMSQIATPDVVTNTTTQPAPTPTAAPTAHPLLPNLIDGSPTLPRTTLNVTLAYYEHSMQVQQAVEIPNNSGDIWEEVVFNIPIHAVADTFFLDTMKVSIGSDMMEGVPSLFGAETVLRVPLPRPAQPGETTQVEMTYRVFIPPLASTDWPPIGTTGWREGLTQAGEWYPALVPYIDGTGWHTWEYRPVGDPTVYPLMNYQLDLTTDEGVAIAGGGPLGRDEAGIWRFEVPAGRGIAFLASDYYEMSNGEANGTPIYSYYLADHALAGQAALEIATQSVLLFEELFGPYPYESLTVAENGFFGGMEYSALISITDYAYVTYAGQPPSLLHALVPHEVAHQWWYGAVGNDQANEPWLDESLAFYSELLYFERYLPDSTGWWWAKRVDIYEPYGPVDATIYSYDYSPAFITSMYGQAARFMRELRSTMGDEAFFAFLRDYYATYSGQIVTAREFKLMAQRHSDEDLAPLFRAYFASPEP